MPQLRTAIVLTSILALCASAVILKTTRAADNPARPPQAADAGALAGGERAVPRAPTQSLAPAAVGAALANGQSRMVAADAALAAEAAAPAAERAAPAAERATPGAGRPQVPEESATIRDDPTIAPDPKQSADNNVSFPNDI